MTDHDITIDDITYNYLKHLLLIKQKVDKATTLYNEYRQMLNPHYDITTIRKLDEQFDLINDWFNVIANSAIYIDNSVSKFIYETNADIKLYKETNENSV